MREESKSASLEQLSAGLRDRTAVSRLIEPGCVGLRFMVISLPMGPYLKHATAGQVIQAVLAAVGIPLPANAAAPAAPP